MSVCSRKRELNAYVDRKYPHVFIIFGASGDLSKKKIYPSLWLLYQDNKLPHLIKIIGYGRSKISIRDIRKQSAPYMSHICKQCQKYNEFWKLNHYISGQYNSKTDFERLNHEIQKFENGLSNRIFYLAVPSTSFADITTNIRENCMTETGWTRIALEKPFGRDFVSAKILSDHVVSLFDESQIYLMDHYLGKEMVQNILAFRFANVIFDPIWNKEHIAAVYISFKEPFGTHGRAEYFDDYGIIRDVMQNHLLQILTLIAMDKPHTTDSGDIRDEKVKVLKDTKIVVVKDVVLGQYVGDPNREDDAALGYLDDPRVPNDSITPTYAVCVLQVANSRWQNVPFIISCGKALNEHKTEVRIQFKETTNIFDEDLSRNEIIMQIQPDESIFIKVMVRTPGLSLCLAPTDLDLNFDRKFMDFRKATAYENVIIDVFNGFQVYFVRSDELQESWKIFTPLLEMIETNKIKPVLYTFGTTRLKEEDELLKKNNFIIDN